MNPVRVGPFDRNSYKDLFKDGKEPMLLKDHAVKTELGEIKTIVAHCDYCGKKHMVGDGVVGGAMGWHEARRFDRDMPPIHFCCLDHHIRGLQRFQANGVKELDRGNWPIIHGLCCSAKEE